MDSGQFLDNELNQDSLREYLRWKFPEMGRDKEIDLDNLSFVLNFLKNTKYKKLVDINAAVDRSQAAWTKLSSQLDSSDACYRDNAHLAALISLALADKELRARIGFSLAINDAIRINAIDK